jgi:hypothetical protein
MGLTERMRKRFHIRNFRPVGSLCFRRICWPLYGRTGHELSPLIEQGFLIQFKFTEEVYLTGDETQLDNPTGYTAESGHEQ